MAALQFLVILALYLSVIAVDLSKFSTMLDACRSVVNSIKRLWHSIHHRDE